MKAALHPSQHPYAEPSAPAALKGTKQKGKMALFQQKNKVDSKRLHARSKDLPFLLKKLNNVGHDSLTEG